MDHSTFISRIAQGAKNTQEKYGILASATIAQATVESSWGDSAPGNMLFGIKAGKDWTGKKQLLWTHEYLNGKYVRVQAYFRAYDNWEESIEDHGKVIFGYSRYENIIGVKNYRTVCNNLQKDGYANAPDYASVLIGRIEKNNLNQYDSGPIRVLNPPVGETGVYSEPDYKYPINAKATASIDVRYDDGKIASGHKVFNGDAICILSVNYDLQLAEIIYPVSSGTGFMHGWISNNSSITKNHHFKWKNGSTAETVYKTSDGSETIGKIYANEYATPLYFKDGRYALLYNTSKGNETKFGFVNYNGGFSF